MAIRIGLAAPAAIDYEFHFTADDVVESGGAVSQLNDQSSNGNDAVMSGGAYQPSYNSTDANLNGEPSITFNNDVMDLSIPAVIKSSDSFTMFWVGNVDTGERFDIIGDAFKAEDNITIFEDLGYVRIRAESFTNAGATTANVTNCFLYSSTMDTYAVWCITIDGTTAKLFKNGSLEDSNTTLANNFAPYTIGVLSTQRRSKGTIADFRIKNQYDLSEINSVGSELATKYGFTWNTIT